MDEFKGVNKICYPFNLILFYKKVCACHSIDTDITIYTNDIVSVASVINASRP
jgi:hypothetical protein